MQGNQALVKSNYIPSENFGNGKFNINMLQKFGIGPPGGSSQKKSPTEESKSINLQNHSASKTGTSKSKIFSELLDDVTYVQNPSD